jgi:hypothetical protein
VDIAPDDKIKAAVASRNLWLEEVKRAQKAVEEANERINFLIETRVKELNLKAKEGELIYFPEYDLSYFWANEHLHQIPSTVLGDNYDRKENGL